jgi:NAD(P)-dependent dehydrogenase (short-subunit alcohol dehydrogenase family)
VKVTVTDFLGLQDRAVLVAGAGGIGGTCAVALASAGARVVASDLDESRLEALQQAAVAAGTEVKVLTADLANPATCQRVVEEAAAILGGLDVFVHAVGMNDRRPVLDVSDELWQQILDTNLSSAFWTAREAGRLMCESGYGRIVFLSSVSGLLAHQRHAPYAASKGAVNQLCRVMAHEWASSGVTVNAVAPGYTETDLTRDYLEKPGMRDEMTALVPAGRLGTVDDLVGPVLFLCSDRSAFVTGHVMYVDGGRTLV